jgi:hypothetical protein
MSESTKLSQLRICVEKPLPGEMNMMHTLRYQANSEQHFHRLRAAFFTRKLWPKGTTIRVSFYPRSSSKVVASFTSLDVMRDRREPGGSAAKLDPIEKKIRSMSPEDAVKKVVHERIQPICGLKFVFVSTGGNVRIGFDGDGGSWSMVGTDCLKSKAKTMNFAWIDAAPIMHEFGHAIGMVHEHQNPKGNPIDWNVPVVDAWAAQTQNWSKETTYRNIIQHYKADQINGSSYDKYSIMLYFFPKRLTDNRQFTRINERLSGIDVKWIAKMYPGGHLSPSEFYERAYGETLSEGEGQKKKSWVKMPLMLVWLIPLILAAIVGFLLLGRWLAKRRRGRYGR